MTSLGLDASGAFYASTNEGYLAAIGAAGTDPPYGGPCPRVGQGQLSPGVHGL